MVFWNIRKGNSYNSPSGISAHSLQLWPISALRCYVTIFEEKKNPWNLTWCCFIKIWRTCQWNFKVKKNLKTCCFMHYTVYSEVFIRVSKNLQNRRKYVSIFIFVIFCDLKSFFYMYQILPNIMFVNWIFCDVKLKLDHRENNRINGIHIYTVHTVYTRYIRITYLFNIQEDIKRHFRWNLSNKNKLHMLYIRADNCHSFCCILTQT